MRHKPSLGSRNLLSALEKASSGSIVFRFPDGSLRTFGQGPVVCEGKIHSWEVLDRILLRGDIGFAESYIEGSFEVDHPDRLIEWACLNERAMRGAIYGAAFALVTDRFRHWIRRNTVVQAKKNIESHYDLGNDFYRLWLDPTMTYSSALFESETQGLQEAQAAKYERILEQAEVKAGDHLLEIGCGWGGFLSHAVKSRGCRVTALTISQRQFDACKARIEAEGLAGRADVLLQDYRSYDRGGFDQVVSIEMIEAVGQEYWAAYFKKIRSSLKSGGKAVIQSITIREDLFRSYSRGTDFIQRYIFPGGLLPTQSTFDRFGNRAALELLNMHSFSSSYEKTLRLWRKSFVSAQTEVARLGFSQEFSRMWELYLAYCEGAFRVGRISVCQATLQAAVGEVK